MMKKVPTVGCIYTLLGASADYRQKMCGLSWCRTAQYRLKTNLLLCVNK
ncbi:hypothetical protein SOVF_145600 [Spinacia oleracea]|nr:hypothetical protein SOVF_145600 [Spinacia oleracea]